MRDKKINFCQACYGCTDTGGCVQDDDFHEILLAFHEADGGDGAPLFRRGGILPAAAPAAFKRKDMKRLEGDSLCLRYLKQEG